MLQVIKYYMTSSFGLLQHIALIVLIVLYALVNGSKITEDLFFIASGLSVAYFGMFTGFFKKQKYNTLLSSDIPLSWFKLHIAKFISYYLYIIQYIIWFVLFSEITGEDSFDVVEYMLMLMPIYYITSSLIGKVKLFRDNQNKMNMPNLVYTIIAFMGMFLLFNIPSIESNSNDDFLLIYGNMLIHLAALLLFTALDFFTMYLNRNQKIVA